MADAGAGQRGQSTVEFGVSAIVLLLILFGLIDLGRAFYFGVGLQSATREAARHGSWFDSASSTNPYLYDGQIKEAVDGILTHSGLQTSALQNPGTTCPATSDGNTAYNPPYAVTASGNHPLLYICYDNTPGLDVALPPGNNAYSGHDLNVILVMNFGLASGFLQGPLGNSIPIAVNTHMTVGGY